MLAGRNMVRYAGNFRRAGSRPGSKYLKFIDPPAALKALVLKSNVKTVSLNETVFYF